MTIRQFSVGLPDAAASHGDMDMMVWATDPDHAATLYAAYVIDADWVDRDDTVGAIRVVDFGATPGAACVRGWDEIETIVIPFREVLPDEPADPRQTSFCV